MDRIAEMREILRQIRRTAEMSANIMRDRRRTGAWDGAEKVARQFDRIAALARNHGPSDGEIYSAVSKSGMTEAEVDAMYADLDAKLAALPRS